MKKGKAGLDFGARAATAARATGIGLAVVRRLLEPAGGRVELEESPLVGGAICVDVRSSETIAARH